MGDGFENWLDKLEEDDAAAYHDHNRKMLKFHLMEQLGLDSEEALHLSKSKIFEPEVRKIRYSPEFDIPSSRNNIPHLTKVEKTLPTVMMLASARPDSRIWGLFGFGMDRNYEEFDRELFAGWLRTSPPEIPLDWTRLNVLLSVPHSEVAAVILSLIHI